MKTPPSTPSAEGIEPKRRSRVDEAKARLLDWADEVDERSRRNRPRLIAAIAGGAIAGLAGLALIRSRTGGGAGGGPERPAAGRRLSGSIIRLAVIGRIASAVYPLAAKAWLLAAANRRSVPRPDEPR